jgi:WD40 repeat protein
VCWGRMLALGLHGGRVMLVDEATGEVRWQVQAHSGARWGAHCRLSPNGRFVASVGDSGQHWTLWDAASGAVHRVGARHDGTGACICGGEGEQILEACPVVAHTAGLLEVAFSPCGQRIATGGFGGAVILWDAQTGEAERRMHTGPGQIWSLSISADGTRLASAGYQGSIRVWDAATGALPKDTRPG